MSRGTIAIDIDDTLYDFGAAARDGFLKLYTETGDSQYRKGVYFHSTEWRSPADVCGLKTWLKVIELCHQDDVILAQQPFLGAAETCQQLSEEGWKLLYISSRADGAYDATKNWLLNNDFPLSEETGRDLLLCVDHDKMPYLHGCQYLIDDRPKTAIEFIYNYDWKNRFGSKNAERQRACFMKAYPYNQNLTDIPNLYLSPSWAGINLYLVKLGILAEPAYIPLAAA